MNIKETQVKYHQVRNHVLKNAEVHFEETSHGVWFYVFGANSKGERKILVCSTTAIKDEFEMNDAKIQGYRHGSIHFGVVQPIYTEAVKTELLD